MKKRLLVPVVMLTALSLSACGEKEKEPEQVVVETPTPEPTATSTPTPEPTATPTPSPTPTPIPVKDVYYEDGGITVTVPMEAEDPTQDAESMVFTDKNGTWSMEFSPMERQKFDNARENVKIDYDKYTEENTQILNAKTEEFTCQGYGAVSYQYDMNPDAEKEIYKGCSHFYQFVDYKDGLIGDANGVQIHIYSTEQYAEIEKLLQEYTIRFALDSISFDEPVTSKETTINGVTAQYPAGWNLNVTGDMSFVVTRYGNEQTSIFLELKKDIDPQENAGYGDEEVREISIGDVTYYANYFGGENGHLTLYAKYNEDYSSCIDIYLYDKEKNAVSSETYWEYVESETITSFLEGISYNVDEFVDPDADKKDSSGFICDDNGMIVGYEGEGGEVLIPAKIGNQEITDVDSYIFKDSGATITAVDIEEGIQFVDALAFNGCDSITSISFPSTVETIYDGTFDGLTALEEVKFVEGTKTLEEGLFSQCESLKHVTIPEGITTIEKDTFAGCISLEDITLPDSVKTVKEYAFNGAGSGKGSFTCGAGVTFEQRALLKTNFTNVTFGENCDLSAEGIMSEAFVSKLVIGEGCTELGNSFCTNPYVENEDKEYVLNDAPFELILPESIKKIGESAFYGRIGLAALDLKNLEEMGVSAFGETGIEELTIPGSLKAIPSSAFSKCTKLHEITMEEGVETIGTYAFSSAGRQGNEIMKELYRWLPPADKYEQIKSIAKDPVADGVDYVVNIYFPSTVTYVDAGAFNNIIVDGMYFLFAKTVEDMPEFHEEALKVSYIGQAYFEKEVMDERMSEFDSFLAQHENVGERAYYYDGRNVMIYDKVEYEEKYGPLE